MTQRVAALFDSLEQLVRHERQEIASLRQRLASLESENQHLRHSLATLAESAEQSGDTESPAPVSHAERGYPLPRRVISPAPAAEPGAEAEREPAGALAEGRDSQVGSAKRSAIPAGAAR